MTGLIRRCRAKLDAVCFPCLPALAAVTWNQVDHSCYQCGVLVEDGTAFCRQCSAPQIRVAGPELPASAPVPAEDLPATRPYLVTFPAAMEWSHALSAAALAGLVAAVAMAITGGGFGLGMLASGAFAVLIYHRRSPQTTLTAGVGARLGVVTGFISSVALALLLSLEMAFLHSGDQLRKELRSTLLQSIEQAASRAGTDPQTQQAVEFLRSPQGLTLMLFLGLFVTLLLFLLCSSVGGAISAALLSKRKH